MNQTEIAQKLGISYVTLHKYFRQGDYLRKKIFNDEDLKKLKEIIRIKKINGQKGRPKKCLK